MKKLVAVVALACIPILGACGGDDKPSDGDIVKALVNSGIDEDQAKCVAAALPDSADVFKQIEKGVVPAEVQKAIADCIVNGG